LIGLIKDGEGKAEKKVSNVTPAKKAMA